MSRQRFARGLFRRPEWALCAALAAMAVGPARALTIDATIDSSVTGSANSAAIQGEINEAIGIVEGLFTDPITVSVDFRYATTQPDGTTPLGAGTLALSVICIYEDTYDAYISRLNADEK